ncbi:MAG: hypothetical protein AMXMBFR83_08730 [Phycisphaerae bacterium]
MLPIAPRANREPTHSVPSFPIRGRVGDLRPITRQPNALPLPHLPSCFHRFPILGRLDASVNPENPVAAGGGDTPGGRNSGQTTCLRDPSPPYDVMWQRLRVTMLKSIDATVHSLHAQLAIPYKCVKIEAPEVSSTVLYGWSSRLVRPT